MATVIEDPDAPRNAEQIRAGIERARNEIELSVTDLRDEVSRTLDLRRLVRENPWPFLGGAFAVGFILGHRWGGRPRRGQ